MAAWSEEKVANVPFAMTVHMASMSSGVSRRGGRQTHFAPVDCNVGGAVDRDIQDLPSKFSPLSRSAKR